MFFITAFEHLPVTGKPFNIGDARTFGYFSSFEEAAKRLHANACDMHETIYDFAVVEQIGFGIHPEVETRQFFQYDKKRDGYFEISEPDSVANVCNFALG